MSYVLTHVTADRCTYPWDWAMITADGAVRPCCYGGIVGNLNENSLEEIWNGRTMLEVRYFIEQGRLHSVCRGAMCHYAQARAEKEARPQEIPDCAYTFADVTVNIAVQNGSTSFEICGKIVNAGTRAWFLTYDDGSPRIQLGARIVDPNGTVLEHLSCAMREDILFPGERSTFQFAVSPRPEALLKIDLCYESRFWFEDRGAKPLQIPLL